ncbi:MAG: hypothetical protein N2111_14375 [Candidatus Sumerlaeaceae bacterium]|nr:hypothetical protein [Candidatus Sumerlaeaceae bacterium]
MKARLYQRSLPQVFGISFLDVFACTLGILLLILNVFALQVGRSYSNEAALHRIADLERQRAEAGKNMLEAQEMSRMANAWARHEQTATPGQKHGENLQQEVQALEQSLASLAANAKNLPNLSELRNKHSIGSKELESVESEYRRARDSVMNPFQQASASGTVRQAPRFIVIDRDAGIDLQGKGRPLKPGSEEWEQLLSSMRARRSSEYILFIVKPEGVMALRDFEASIKSAGLIYGIEPYTQAWDSILSCLSSTPQRPAQP